MPIKMSNLDDRKFQDIVDQAKRLINQYCPEWTDHNVSDPGVALIELFAWMSELLLYRVNQVPDRMYIKFLETVGLNLRPPRPAATDVTFYLSAPQETDVLIPSGTEVATVRTENSPSIIFTTAKDLVIRPPQVMGMFTRAATKGRESALIPHDFKDLKTLNRSIPLFQSKPEEGDAFWIGFEEDHSHHVLALVLECESAGGAGLDPRYPPIAWEVFQGGVTKWGACTIEYDGTGGFNKAGEVILRLPQMMRGSIDNRSAFWLMCRYSKAASVDEDGNKYPNTYQSSPEIEGIHIESRGGTVTAHHAVVVHKEDIGSSSGEPGQRFRLLHAPVLARSPEAGLTVKSIDGRDEHWSEVQNFANSTKDDPHYTLDSDGELQLGPTLIQPNGTVYRYGKVPEKNALLRFHRYQYGGGILGNVPASTLITLKTSIPYIARVTNHIVATQGEDAESLEHGKLRIHEHLGTRTRAVTADDYEYIARHQVPGVARAHCHAPGAQPGTAGEPKPGQVILSILPKIEPSEGAIDPSLLQAKEDTLHRVREKMDACRLIGTTLEVRGAQYVWITVQAKVRVRERSDPALALEVQREAEKALYRYLNPYSGGPDGQGWPFGRALHEAELLSLLQRIEGVEFVDEIRVATTEPGSKEAPQQAPKRLVIEPFKLITSVTHRVIVT